MSKSAHSTPPARRGLIRRLLADPRGSVYAFGAVVALPLVGFLGISADAARAYMVQARLSTSVDAAALAGAKFANTATYGNDIQKYFKSNFPTGFMGAQITSVTYKKTSDDKGNLVVRVNATAKVPTAFMHLFGFESVNVSAEADATRESGAMDVVLSMDMSGSMGSYSGGKKKIDAARDAAKTLVDILYGATETKSTLKMGLVPWNGTVNIMKDESSASPISKWIPALTKQKFVTPFTNPVRGNLQSHVWEINNSPVLLLEKPDSQWKGCVYARYLKDGNTLNDADDNLGYVDLFGWKGWEPRYYSYTTSVLKGKKKKKKKNKTTKVDCDDCTPCLKHGITPLNQSKSKILSAIDRLKSPTGHTNIPQGLAWAWRTLRNTSPFTEGTPDDPKVSLTRAIVLLTDGANCSAEGDGYKGVWGDNCNSYSTGKMNERLQQIAAKVKADGVIIYAIQFGYNSSSMATLLKSVASGNGAPYYQYAPDSASLKKVFTEIGNSLNQLRLSK